jgi:hypothetical protein
LSSFRVYIDYIGTYLKREYGHASQHIKSFERCTSFFYDKAFAYRFMYKLRNHSQHCGFPINGINFSAKLNGETGKINATLKVSFNRIELLENYDGWTTVKKDLERMPEEFDVMSLTNILHRCISDLAKFLRRLIGQA